MVEFIVQKLVHEGVRMVNNLRSPEIIKLANQRSILRRLAELQYQRNAIEFKQGTFRVLGDVIDVYPADSDNQAIRVEMQDDEIEGLSYFDPLTGEVQTKLPRFTIS